MNTSHWPSLLQHLKGHTEIHHWKMIVPFLQLWLRCAVAWQASAALRNDVLFRKTLSSYSDLAKFITEKRDYPWLQHLLNNLVPIIRCPEVHNCKTVLPSSLQISIAWIAYGIIPCGGLLTNEIMENDLIWWRWKHMEEDKNNVAPNVRNPIYVLTRNYISFLVVGR